MIYCFFKWKTVHEIYSYINMLNINWCNAYTFESEEYLDCRKQLSLIWNFNNPENIIIISMPWFIIDNIDKKLSDYYNFSLTYKKIIKPRYQLNKYKICYLGDLYIEPKNKNYEYITHPIEWNFKIKKCIPFIFKNWKIVRDNDWEDKIFKEKLEYEKIKEQ